MIKAINNYVIVKKETVENTSDSGIITSSAPTKTIYKVVATTEETKDLKDKQVYIKDSYVLDDEYVSVCVKDIVGWK